MPWIINDKNEYQYVIAEDLQNPSFDSQELNQMNEMDSIISPMMDSYNDFDNFLFKEATKPIKFTVDNGDGTTEEKSLNQDETRAWLLNNKQVFREVGRDIQAHLLAFAVKNGLSLDDLRLLKDHPEDPKCSGIQNTLDNARKEMFELASSKDSRLPEGKTLTVNEEKLSNFYSEYFEKLTGQFDKLLKSSKSSFEKNLDFMNLFKEFQSVGLQTLGTGSNSKPLPGQTDGKKIVSSVNQQLNAKGLPFSFDHMLNLGRTANVISQTGQEIKDSHDKHTYTNNPQILRTIGFSSYNKTGYAMSYLDKNVWYKNNDTNDIIKWFDDVKGQDFMTTSVMINTFVPQSFDPDVTLDQIEEAESYQNDLRLDNKFYKFGDQYVPDHFEYELESLADNFGKQSNPADPQFSDMTKSLLCLSNVYKNPNSDDRFKLVALRHAQMQSAAYLNSHQSESLSNSPSPSVLLAEKIFTLTGSQKLAMQHGLEKGSIIKGSREYAQHNLNLDEINKFAPAKIKSKALNSRRFRGLMTKHVNAHDVLPDAQKHIKEQTSADFSKINEVRSGNKEIPVHSGLGKKNKEQGGYNLEFVCAGSSNIQMAKTYKGQTGRNEVGKVELDADPVAQEINNDINRKYKITYDSKKSGDNSKYEFALEQEYGKPLYLDSKNTFHENADPSYKLMAGVRKLEKGTTTRYNVSGTLEKIMGFIVKPGLSNTGEHSIEKNTSYITSLADQWLSNINDEYSQKIHDGKEDTLKPINIMFKGQSRGGVAANEASMMVNHLIEHKYPNLRKYVHISTHILDPVPGFGSNLSHPELDLNKGDFKLNGKDMRGLNASAVERKNNESTVFYGIHSNKKAFFSPQAIKGADRLILSCMNHDTGIFDSVDGHKRGYLAENGHEYRGSGFNELDKGLYFIDENKNMVSCKNSQEAHKAIDAMLGKHGRFSSQWSRHNKMHDMVDSWFKTHAEVITPKDTRYPIEQAMAEDRNALKTVLNSFDHTKPETELAGDPNDILKRGVSSLLSHQLLLDQIKEKNERIYPPSTKDTKALVDAADKSGLADKIRKSESFNVFFESLNKEDIQALASGDPTKLQTYALNYKAINQLPADTKQTIKNINLSKRADNPFVSKSMFFEKHIDINGEWQEKMPNKPNMPANKNTLNMVAVSRLMQQGHSLKDIMDPFKLERQRQEIGDKILQDYAGLNAEELATKANQDLLNGFKQSMSEMEARFGKLDENNKVDLSKPENQYIYVSPADQKTMNVFDRTKASIGNFNERINLSNKLNDMKTDAIKELADASKGLSKLASEGESLSDKEFTAQKNSLMKQVHSSLAKTVFSNIVDENCKINGDYDEKALRANLNPEKLSAQMEVISNNIEKIIENSGSVGNVIKEITQATKDHSMSDWYTNKVNNPQAEINKPSQNRENEISNEISNDSFIKI